MDFSTLDSNFTMRWQSTALLALQEATEAYLVHLFEDASVIARLFGGLSFFFFIFFILFSKRVMRTVWLTWHQSSPLASCFFFFFFFAPLCNQ